jgi:hypothetical protein
LPIASTFGVVRQPREQIIARAGLDQRLQHAVMQWRVAMPRQGIQHGFSHELVTEHQDWAIGR